MGKLIIDTDLGYDCDDAGAIALANIFHNRRFIDLQFITHCVNEPKGIQTINLIDRYYGNDNIPLGMSADYPFDVKDFYNAFYKKLSFNPSFKGFETEPSFYRFIDKITDNGKNGAKQYSEALELFRNKLINLSDGAVLLCIGQLNNLSKLLYDAELYGLVKKKIKTIVIMCGNFTDYGSYFDDGEVLWPGEFNVIIDVDSSKSVFMHDDLPIDVLDFNQGGDVLVGDCFINQKDNPVAIAYKTIGKGKPCSSWDIVAFLYATGLYYDYFSLSDYGTVTIEKNGKTCFQKGKGKHRLVSLKTENKSKLAAIIKNFLAKGKN